MTASENENDQNDHDHFDRDFLFKNVAPKLHFFKKVLLICNIFIIFAPKYS